MLNSETIRKIEAFVQEKPRSVQEIAHHLNKNWRTADRYIEQIEKEFGTLETRTFREGTRGALKIVFLASVEKISHSVFQEKIEQNILSARKKEDFSAFDIFQHIQDKNKSSKLIKSNNEAEVSTKNLSELFSKGQRQLLIFSGNLSFINFKDGKLDMFKVIEDLVKKGVSIKVLCRVDFSGRENIEKILSLNFKYGKECVEIRHREHPLRATIFDKKSFHMKEIKEPTGRIHELDKKVFISYTAKDKDWAEWLSRVFWKMFNGSIDANKRLEEMNKIFK